MSQGGQVLEVVEGVHDDQAKSLKRDQNTHTSLRKMSPNSQHRSQDMTRQPCSCQPLRTVKLHLSRVCEQHTTVTVVARSNCNSLATRRKVCSGEDSRRGFLERILGEKNGELVTKT